MAMTPVIDRMTPRERQRYEALAREIFLLRKRVVAKASLKKKLYEKVRSRGRNRRAAARVQADRGMGAEIA